MKESYLRRRIADFEDSTREHEMRGSQDPETCKIIEKEHKALRKRFINMLVDLLKPEERGV